MYLLLLKTLKKEKLKQADRLLALIQAQIKILSHKAAILCLSTQKQISVSGSFFKINEQSFAILFSPTLLTPLVIVTSYYACLKYAVETQDRIESSMKDCFFGSTDLVL